MCGLGQSVGFLTFRSFVFCVLSSLGRETLFGPCLPGPTSPGQPREHQENCCLVGAPPCGYGSDDCHKCKDRNGMCLVEEMRRKGACGAPGLLPPSAPQCLLLVVTSVPELDPVAPAVPAHHPKTPRRLQTCLPKGVILCFLQFRILSWILPREALELSP